MKFEALDGVTYNNDKFPKLIIDGYYSKSLYVPLQDGVNPLNGDDFSIIKTKEKGTIMAVKPVKVDNRIVVAGQIWGGFRGGADVLEDNTTAKVMWKTTSSKHCKGCVSLMAIITLNETLVVKTEGRGGSGATTFTNNNGTLVKAEYTWDEWKAFNSDQEEFEEV